MSTPHYTIAQVHKKKCSGFITKSIDLLDPTALLTGAAVKEAASKLRPKKSDVSIGFTSDAILHAPDILFDQLAMAYRSWIVHGTVTPTLLACAFLPLLKSSLKDPADPGCYRAIAGSSLILKLFEKNNFVAVGGHSVK